MRSTCPSLCLWSRSLLTLLLDQEFRYWIQFGPDRLPLLLAFAALIVLALSAFASPTGGDGMRENTKRVFKLASGMIIYMYLYHNLNTNLSIKFLLNSYFFVIILSSMVALCELLTGTLVPWKEISSPFPSGLESWYVPFAYSVVTPLSAAILISVCARDFSSFASPRLAYATGAIGTIGVVITSSRSALLAIILAIPVTSVVLFKINKRLCIKYMALCLILMVAGISVYPFMVKDETVHETRFYDNYIFYLPIIASHPLGLGDVEIYDEEHADVARDKLWTASARAESLFGFEMGEALKVRVLDHAPHNIFMTVGLEYGLIGIVALAGIYIFVFKQGIRAINSPNSPLPLRSRELVSVFLASVSALLIHSMFHNNNILQNEPRNWVFLAMICRISRTDSLPMIV